MVMNYSRFLVWLNFQNRFRFAVLQKMAFLGFVVDSDFNFVKHSRILKNRQLLQGFYVLMKSMSVLGKFLISSEGLFLDEMCGFEFWPVPISVSLFVVHAVIQDNAACFDIK